MSSALNPFPLPGVDRSIRAPMRDTDDRTARQGGEVRKLTSLLDVSQALSSPVNIKSAFHRVLEILERYHNTSRSVIALPREDGKRLHLHASIGIRSQHSDAPLGGTLAQQVFESGRPIVIPRASREPALAELWAEGPHRCTPDESRGTTRHRRRPHLHLRPRPAIPQVPRRPRSGARVQERPQLRPDDEVLRRGGIDAGGRAEDAAAARSGSATARRRERAPA